MGVLQSPVMSRWTSTGKAPMVIWRVVGGVGWGYKNDTKKRERQRDRQTDRDNSQKSSVFIYSLLLQCQERSLSVLHSLQSKPSSPKNKQLYHELDKACAPSWTVLSD